MTVNLDTAAALKYFKAFDPVIYRLLQRALAGSQPIIIPRPQPADKYFSILISSIISQQISVAAARTIENRVLDTLGSLTPEAVLAADITDLRACGLSERKVNYLKQNAADWHEIPYGNFVRYTDEEIITTLTRLHGIGRWSAEMFLIFCLARPDVFSFGDLGLRQSLYRNYNYKPHFVRKIRTTVEAWSPHRTLAALALWHQKDNAPGGQGGV